MALASTLLLLLPVTAALESGVVGTFGDEPKEGATSQPDQEIDLEIVSSRGLGSAFVNGPMTAVELTTSANISGDFDSGTFYRGSESGSSVRFVDSLAVNAEGVAEGTELIVTVAWIVDGTLNTSSSDNDIRVRGRMELDVVNVPDFEGQRWRREDQNYGQPTADPLGLVTFEFPYRAGEFPENNVVLRATATSTCGIGPSVFPEEYTSLAESSMTLTFVGAVAARTKVGKELFRWTTASASGLDYGSRDDTPVSDPILTVSESPQGDNFVRLSWPTLVDETYTIEESGTLEGWTTEREVPGTGTVIAVDVPRSGAEHYYRLITRPAAGG